MCVALSDLLRTVFCIIERARWTVLGIMTSSFAGKIERPVPPVIPEYTHHSSFSALTGTVNKFTECCKCIDQGPSKDDCYHTWFHSTVVSMLVFNSSYP